MSTPPIPTQEHYPPFVLTEADRARWDLAVAIAERTSALYEADGRPNGEFVFHYSRTVYFSPIETGDPSELADGEQADQRR